MKSPEGGFPPLRTAKGETGATALSCRTSSAIAGPGQRCAQGPATGALSHMRGHVLAATIWWCLLWGGWWAVFAGCSVRGSDLQGEQQSNAAAPRRGPVALCCWICGAS